MSALIISADLADSAVLDWDPECAVWTDSEELLGDPAIATEFLVDVEDVRLISVSNSGDDTRCNALPSISHGEWMDSRS